MKTLNVSKRRMVISGGTISYFLGDEEVSESVYQAAEWKTKPPNYEKGECPGMHPDYADFSNTVDETHKVKGRRYYGQLAKYPGDPKAFFSHKNDAIEAAKKRGWEADDS